MRPINGSARYANAAAFRRAVDDRLRSARRTTGRSLEELRREFLFQRFLAMVFTGGPEQEWVLKGGAGLLMRLPDARFSRDLDLFRQGELSEDDAIMDLRRRTAARPGDQLTFVIGDTVRSSSVHAVVTLKVSAYIGARFGDFRWTFRESCGSWRCRSGSGRYR